MAITFSFFFLTRPALGQEPGGYIDSSALKAIISLYLNGQYDIMDAFLANYGYSKSSRDPFKVLNGFSENGSFLYKYDAACQFAKYDRVFWIKYNCQNENSTGDCDYILRNIYYSDSLHEDEEDQLIELLKHHYAYNLVEAKTKGDSGPYNWVNTNTPESVKRSGDLYLFKAELFVLGGHGLSSSASFCGLTYRIGYEMHFRRGYASLDSIGYVSTNEGSNLRLREGTSLNANILTSIPDKSKVVIIEYSNKVDLIDGQSGNWYKIKYDDKTGWVWGNFIKRENEK